MATGSKAVKINLPGVNDSRVITTNEALAMDYLPGRWVIIGGGVVGVEFASLYRALGCEVTLLEILPDLVSGMDREISAFLKRHLKQQGVKVFTCAKVEALQDKEGEVVVHYRIRTGKFPLAASGRAQAIGESEGFVKIICADEGEVLGVHIVGPAATELAAEAALAIKLGVTAKEIASVIHAHPTVSEGLFEASLATLGRAIHII